MHHEYWSLDAARLCCVKMFVNPNFFNRRSHKVCLILSNLSSQNSNSMFLRKCLFGSLFDFDNKMDVDLNIEFERFCKVFPEEK